MSERLATGVIGVGSMGRNHARVYRELPSAELVGVADADHDRAADVAADYGTRALAPDRLLDAVEAVSIAVPTRHHYATAGAAIDANVDVLVEKPFVDRPANGTDLIDRARAAGVTLQVGQIERFNPAVQALLEFTADLDVIAVDARRLGPPIDRDIDVSPVLDLMIHDIDVVGAVVDGGVTDLCATTVAGDPYVSATLDFDSGVVGTLTASRVTQQKVRTLSITARDCRVTVDYTDQSIEIHRQSRPEWVERDGDVSFRHRNIVEHPTVEHGEPLMAELASFVDAAVTGQPPVVSGEDGLRAVSVANKILDAVPEPRPQATAEAKQ